MTVESAGRRCRFYFVAGDKALKEAIKEAADIASVVPESMQERAFDRALTEILGHSEESGGQAPAHGKAKKSARRSGKSESRMDRTSDLVRSINRTEHPEINDAMPVLERSLSVLLIAKDFGVDGLSPPRIAEILTQKFRVKTARTHVSQQLSAATKLVDREKVGRGFNYRIMGAGEKHLEEFKSGTEESSTGSKIQKSPRRKAPRKRSDSKEPKSSEKPKSQRSTGSRPGPKAAVQMLIDAEFFKSPKTIGDIQDHLRIKHGLQFKPTDLSPGMTRLLRDGKLDRDRNESGKYEYQQS